MKVIIPLVGWHLCGGVKVLIDIAEALLVNGHEAEIVLPPTDHIDYDIPCKVTTIPYLHKDTIPYGDIILTNFYPTVRPSMEAWPNQCVRISQGFEPLNVSHPEALWSYQQDIPILSNSHWVDDLIYKHVGKRSKVINLGIDLNIFYPGSLQEKLTDTKETKVILYIARAPEDGYELKGFADFIESMKIVQKEYANQFIVHLICPDRELSLPDIPYQYFPAQSNEGMANHYRAADLYVSSSWFEGFSLPPLEAMACGTPVVTTIQGGNLDFCEHMKNCYMTPPQDPKSLASAILAVLSDVPLAVQLTFGGLATAQKRNKVQFAKNVVDQLESIFNDRKERVVSQQLPVKHDAKHKTSIVVLTCNQLEYTKRCLDSIRKNTSEEIELIFVDNHSTDGTVEYLQSQTDIKTIFNEVNAGFPMGCNQGYEIATGDTILFLNNDTIVTKNWLSNMLHLLYSDDKIGMVGPVSNYVTGVQQIPVEYRNQAELDSFAEQYCSQNKGKSLSTLRLVGFCLLAKKHLLAEIGLFSETFGIGSYEDDDLCLRALEKGYQLKIALDSFIHHDGHKTFINIPDINIPELDRTNKIQFFDKWKLDFTKVHNYANQDIIHLIPEDAQLILDIGCGLGSVGVEIKNKQPCEIHGIEINPTLAQIAGANYDKVDLINIEDFSDEQLLSTYDAIIVEDVLEHTTHPWTNVRKLSSYLKTGGAIIATIRSVGVFDSAYLTKEKIACLFPLDLLELTSFSEKTNHNGQVTQLILKAVKVD